MDDPRISIADKLFAAWSSGDPDAPAQFLSRHAVLHDIVDGELKGWPAIRAFFAKRVEKWPDLTVVPDQHWVNDTGIAVNWVMTATAHDDSLGVESKGTKWRSEGMSWLVFDGDKVVREVDYHDGDAMTHSGQPTVLGFRAYPEHHYGLPVVTAGTARTPLGPLSAVR